MFREANAFFKKNLLTETSYRFSFLFNIFGVFLSVLGYFFIDKLFGSRMVEHLEMFGVDYFSYVLLGMAFFSYVGVGMGAIPLQIHQEQTQGTLEAILLTPVKLSTLLFSLASWNLVIATLDMIIYIALGLFFFKIDFSRINPVSSFVTLILTIASFSGLGILSASFVMVFKRGNPVSWIINGLEGLMGGVYFPVSVLPGWLQSLANLLPITHAIRAMELAVFQGYSLRLLAKELFLLFIFSLLLIPAGLIAFQHATKKARSQGTLIQY
jgi:ABC-2 type transport system permease protein